MNSKAGPGSGAVTLGMARKTMWFCELAVVASLLTYQGMMPAARAEEPPPAPPQDCTVEDSLDHRSQECLRGKDTKPDCPETGEGEDATGGPEDSEHETELAGKGATVDKDEDTGTRADDHDHGAGDQEDREEGAENGPGVEKGRAARDEDPGSDEAESCEPPAGVPSAGEPEEAADEPTGDHAEPGDESREDPEGEPGDEQEEKTATEPEGDDESGEQPSSEAPGAGPATGEEAPDESPWSDAPVAVDDPAALDPDVAPPVEDPSSNCIPRHALLDCSSGLGRAPGGGMSGEADEKDVGRSRPAPRGEDSEPPAPAPAGVDDPLAAMPASWRPAGPLSTDALTAALIEGHGKTAPEDYAPFIIAGRASWVDTWGAPRFGPGPAVRRHEGQDVFCDYGAPVLASEKGIVEFDAGGLGGRVARVHRPDGSYWYYAHLSRWNTDRLGSGDAVAPGDVIGYCGNSGNATTSAPHVHFGLYGPDGRAADPMHWLVRWLRAAERAAGLRTRSAVPDASPPDLAALLRDRNSVTPSTRPIKAVAIERLDVAGDPPRALLRAGVAQVIPAEPPTRPSAADQTVELIGLGALLATAYLMRARASGDRSEVTSRAHRHLPKRGHSER